MLQEGKGETAVHGAGQGAGALQNFADREAGKGLGEVVSGEAADLRSAVLIDVTESLEHAHL